MESGSFLIPVPFFSITVALLLVWLLLASVLEASVFLLCLRLGGCFGLPP